MLKTISIVRRNILVATNRKMCSQEQDIIFETINKCGVITLNRPKALNALNLSMVSKLLPQLQQWENTKSLVIIKGAGEKAFCAGGDVKKATDKVEGPKFFRIEYNCNYLIGKYTIPYIALIDGITMGGGIGLSVHGKYRIGTERTVVAMPETKIGLFPDVGGSYFLPRMRDNLGIYLGLTGDRLTGKDVLLAGIATHFVPSQRLSELQKSLYNCEDDSQIISLIEKYNEPSGEFSLEPNMKHIKHCFGAGTVEEIMDRLTAVDNGWSKKTLERLRAACPGSLKVSLAAARRGAALDLAAALRMEFRLARRCVAAHDFPEGVRALLIDKDNSPRWNPRTLQEATDQYVDSFFRDLPEDQELTFVNSKL